MNILSWDDKYNLLKEYLNEHNGEYPKFKDEYKGILIGEWINTQRAIYNNGFVDESGIIHYKSVTLTPNQLEKLDEINFKWSFDGKKKHYDILWNEKYELLKEYLCEHNGEYPETKTIYKNFKIGRWVTFQRTVYNNGKKYEDGSIRYETRVLTKERIDKLNELNFDWNNQYDLLWEERYNLLIDYINAHNGNFPSIKDEYKNFKIGRWTERQGVIYNLGERLEDGSSIYESILLLKERIDKLNEINFPWHKYNHERNKDKWDNRLKLLQEYLNEHNGKYPSKNEYYRGVALGLWVTAQRTIYNNGRITKDGSIIHNKDFLTKKQIDKLNEIGFYWNNGFDSKWDNKYNLLQEYLKEHNGKYPLQNEIYKGVALGAWISTQRKAYIHGTEDINGNIIYKGSILTKERIDKLNEINFKWITYNKRDCKLEILTNERQKFIKKKLLIKLRLCLENTKNEIKSKNDIEEINKIFEKSLSMYY